MRSIAMAVQNRSISLWRVLIAKTIRVPPVVACNFVLRHPPGCSIQIPMEAHR